MYNLEENDIQEIFNAKDFDSYCDTKEECVGCPLFHDARRKVCRRIFHKIRKLKENGMNDNKKVCIFAGSFNPWHCGHDDILEKALNVFDRVIVAIGVNPEKSEFVNHCPQEFKDSFIQQRFYERVEVCNYSGLLVDEIKRQKKEGINIVAFVRGLRNGNDLQYETNLQYWNEDLGIEVPTVYFITDRKHGHISSSSIRQIMNIKKDAL